MASVRLGECGSTRFDRADLQFLGHGPEVVYEVPGSALMYLGVSDVLVHFWVTMVRAQRKEDMCFAHAAFSNVSTVG